ncbi:SGNH/GDSL hydrolase family protein [Bacillus suaedaesalsae]|uniref:SGNH/GDSL hydrolase family protein n=1 Tax=Bacillus suaedaesalsae TaxID=2810349 RepID=A0ABS2DL38_9BACI|nr:SGNH/GDSL hydrolase family protein [Bacillus suaedaesalsae]MBM6619107.1 SGNH/GDSL hydrolase family protein [Bacillus suaedaesalsae]
MRFIAILVVFILAVGSIVVGKIHWNEKISAFSGMKSKVVIENEKPENLNKSAEMDISKYTVNLPLELKEYIEQSFKEKEQIELVLLGSNSTSSEEGTWSNLFKLKLEEVYGDLFTVTVFGIQNKNSNEVVEEKLYEEAVQAKPDILLFEPFILKDNGEVAMNQRLDNIEIMLEAFQLVNPELHILLQPANPLYDATYYPKEVAKLKEFAIKNNITFLNHWENWPDFESEEIRNYLVEDPDMPLKSLPNEKGHQSWANYIANTFTGENIQE